MARPRFSIVIPTRERAHTLFFALRSCLNQQFDDYEIIVCDNCSSSATREALDRIGSPKVKYVRSDMPLAMNDNWELAVSHASGEFITVVGDDDGLLRHALSEADRLLRIYGTPVLRWAWVYYNWPDHPSQVNANRLLFSVKSGCEAVEARRLFQNLVQEPRRFHELPMIYNSFIHRDLIDRVRQQTGRTFKARSPDVYSGFVFAHLAAEFVSVARPMGICGTSGKSYGHALIAGDTAGRAKEFVDLLAPSGLTWNNHVPHLPKLISAVIAESYAQFRSIFDPQTIQRRAERQPLIAAMMRDLREHPHLSDTEWSDAFSEIAQWCHDDPRLKTWFQARFGAESNPMARKTTIPHPWQKGLGCQGFVVDASAFGINDIDAVAEFFEQLFACRDTPVPAPRLQSSRLQRLAKKVFSPKAYRAFKESRAPLRRRAS